MNLNLAGKVALVTGGSKGIGKAVARGLVDEGAKVAICARTRVDLDAAAKELARPSAEIFAVSGDLTRMADVQKIVDATASRFGRIDILVNNAGVLDVAPLGDASPEHFQKVFAVNVFGLAEMTRAAAAHLPDQGGRVINTSSIGARAAIPGLSAYIASKAAVDALTRSFAAELGPRGITVNAVAPGTTDTDMLIRDPKFLDEAVAKTPLGRVGQPADIAGTVAFLASKDAAWVTGQVIDTSGGLRV